MASINLVITYQAGDGAEILAALQAAYATNGNPTPTLAQITTILQNEVTAKVKGIVLAARQKTASNAVPQPDIT